jgi:hypothetical protein
MVACMPIGLHPIGDSGSIRYGVNYDKGKGNMMINKFKTLRGCQLDGLDGEIGAVREFYFDDLDWAIRYLVADTGDWLKGRQVLISPNALARTIQDARPIAIGLTQEQIEKSSSIFPTRFQNSTRAVTTTTCRDSLQFQNIRAIHRKLWGVSLLPCGSSGCPRGTCEST